MFTGNRGIIHNAYRQIIKPFVSKAWITCTLNYKNVRRKVMTGRKWTGLFLLDEATAFAAGHRPCAFCRNKDFKIFKALWLQANDGYFGWPNESMKTIDALLHKERMALQTEKHYQTANVSSLPNGTMVALKNNTTNTYLWYGRKLLKWGIEGYEESINALPNTEVCLLTPTSIVRIFKLGYKPVVHPSVSVC